MNNMIENNMLFYGRVLKQLLQAYNDSVSIELMKEFEALIQMQAPSNDVEPSSNEDDLMRQMAENYATATIEELKKSRLDKFKDNRTEERSVGKECTSRWAPYH